MTTQPGDAGQWRNFGERDVYVSPWVKVSLADVLQPSGERFEYHVVTFRTACIMTVVDESSEHVLMLWRHRVVPDQWNWELPSGYVEKGESPVQCAHRELEEETGYRAAELRHLMTFHPMIGSVRSDHHIFGGRGVTLAGKPTEANEGVAHWVDLASVPRLVTEDKIVSSGTLLGLSFLARLSERAL